VYIVLNTAAARASFTALGEGLVLSVTNPKEA
jgi:hypothetical protein